MSLFTNLNPNLPPDERQIDPEEAPLIQKTAVEQQILKITLNTKFLVFISGIILICVFPIIGSFRGFYSYIEYPLTYYAMAHFLMGVISLVFCFHKKDKKTEPLAIAFGSDLLIVVCLIILGFLIRDPPTFDNFFIMGFTLFICVVVASLTSRFYSILLPQSDWVGLVVALLLCVVGLVILSEKHKFDYNLSEKWGLLILSILLPIFIGCALVMNYIFDSDSANHFKKVFSIHVNESFILSFGLAFYEIFLYGSERWLNTIAGDGAAWWYQIILILLLCLYRIAYLYLSRYSDFYTFTTVFYIGLVLGLKSPTFSSTFIFPSQSGIATIFLYIGICYWLVRVFFLDTVRTKKVDVIQAKIKDNNYRMGTWD